MNVVRLRPYEWVDLSEHVHVMMVGGQDFVLNRGADGSWDLWSCPHLLLVKVGRLGWPWPVTPLPWRDVARPLNLRP